VGAASSRDSAPAALRDLFLAQALRDALEKGSPRATLTDSQRPSAHSLHCDDGWNDCYTQANWICGSRGFEEIDRAQSERLTSSGRSVSPEIEPETQRNDNRAEVEGRVLTIRCR
jgi:hypothetical protein